MYLDTRPRLQLRDSGLDCAAWFHPGVACNTGLASAPLRPRGPSPRSQVRVTHKFPPLINVVHCYTRPPSRQCMRSSPDPPGRGRRRALFLRTITRDMSRLPPARTPSRVSRRDLTLPHALLCVTAHTPRSPRSHPRHVCVAGRRKHALYTYAQCLTSSMSFAPVKFLSLSFLGSFFSMAAVKE